MAQMNLPAFVRFFGPLVASLNALGGSARPSEVRDWIIKKLELSDEELSERLPSGVQSRFENQVHWARFYLKQADIVDASTAGVWTLTEKGRALGAIEDNEALTIYRGVLAKNAEAKRARGTGSPSQTTTNTSSTSTDEVGPAGYREDVASKLISLPASGFERFCQRLLREAGFEEVTVTGKSGDGGIDGIGLLQVNAFVSFKVLFQCKRYSGSISPSQVRDFRGAMQGRADKGIILTTGTFTAEARKEAVRDGVPPIELVDGEKLVDMLEQLELGLKPIKTYELDAGFFEQFI